MCNAALSRGLTRDDVLEMSWGERVLTLQASARGRDSKPGVRKATDAEAMAWMGL